MPPGTLDRTLTPGDRRAAVTIEDAAWHARSHVDAGRGYVRADFAPRRRAAARENRDLIFVVGRADGERFGQRRRRADAAGVRAVVAGAEHGEDAREAQRAQVILKSCAGGGVAAP